MKGGYRTKDEVTITRLGLGRYWALPLGLLILAALYLISLHSYLLFHSLVEIFSCVIAFGIFLVAWNSRQFMKADYLLFVGITYLFVAGLDLLHTLAYKGMGVFPSYDANLPTQLWIATRYLQSGSLLVAPIFFNRKVSLSLTVAILSLISLTIVALIFYWGRFPDCFVEGQGLTWFKKASEYLISLILLGALGILITHRADLPQKVFFLIAWSIGATIGSELAFTFYVSVYGLSNLVGHFFKLIAMYLMYKAIVETGLREPYELLFRELVAERDSLSKEASERKKAEIALTKARDELEQRVEQRTAELLALNKELAEDIAERKRAEEALRRSEAKFLDLYENAPCAYFSVGTDATIRLCNRHAVELSGYSREELIGKPIFELYADQPEAKEKAGKVYKRFLAGEPITDEELQMQRVDGSVVWISLTVNGIRDSNGDLVESRSMVLDITDRKGAELELRRLNLELDAIRSCNQTLIRAVDEQTLLNDICRIICDKAGYRLVWVGYAENGDAKTVRPVACAGVDDGYLATANITWADTERGQGPAGIAIRSGETVYVEDFTTDPRMIPWRESALQRGYRCAIALPLKDECGNVFGALLLYATESSAITPREIRLMEELAGDLAFGINGLRSRIERKRTEDALYEAQQMFRTLVEDSPDIIARYDRDCRRTYVNPTYLKVAEIPQQELLASAPLQRSPLPAASAVVLQNLLRRVLDSGVAEAVDVIWPKADNIDYWYNAYAFPEFDREGRVVSVMTISRDITERKQGEERLRLLNFALDHVREAAFLTDENARLRFVNEESCRILGYTRSDLLGLGVSDIDPDFPMDRWLSHWNDLKTQGSLIFEGRHKTKDDRIFPVEINANYFEYGGQGYNLALVRDITERKQAEQEHLANLRFFESMDRVNRAIQGTNDLEQMMSDVLDIVLSIFDCDRAFLMHPCDPQAASWTSPMERTKPEYPGVLAFGLEIPMDADVAETLRILLAADGPVKFGSGTPYPVPQHMSERFGFKCFMSMVLRPRVGTTWQFGIHQCSYARVWTQEEERLLKEIGRRLTDGLSALLAYRNLRDSMGKLEEAQRIGHIGYWDRDIAGNQVTLAGEACRIFGISAQESVVNLEQWHERWLTLIHPEDLERVNQVYVEAMGSGPRYNVEYRIVRPDGEVRHIHSEANVTRDESGHPIRMLGMMQDITEQKRREEEIRRSHLLLDAIVQNLPLQIFVKEAQELTFVLVNRECQAVTGYPAQELLGKTDYDFFPTEQADFFVSKDRETISKGVLVDIPEEVLESKSGDTKILHTRKVPIIDESGKPLYLLGISEDITAQKSLQSQLFQAQKMEAIGTLAGGIAHDFNNILQVALGYSELILGYEDLPKRYRANVHQIRESARRGADLVKRLLTFSRKTEIKPQPLNLNRRINEMRKMLERAIPKMIEIQLVLDEDVATINADPTQVDQVLMNLAVNARDAMPDGGRLIFETANVVLDEEYVASHLDARLGRHVLLSVSDTGVGMDKETLARVFEPFYTTKAVGEGTGLGLAMVHGIVHQHGGHIRGYSEPGQGTTFKIYFPALVADEELEETIAKIIELGGSETILLADDEEFVRDFGQQLLSGQGYKVLTASNGKEALEVYRSRSDEISLVILDLVMPEMGGKQCLQRLLEINPKAKVLIASGFSTNGPMKDALTAGAKGFVAKPFALNQLLKAVRETLDND